MEWLRMVRKCFLTIETTAGGCESAAEASGRMRISASFHPSRSAAAAARRSVREPPSCAPLVCISIIQIVKFICLILWLHCFVNLINLNFNQSLLNKIVSIIFIFVI